MKIFPLIAFFGLITLSSKLWAVDEDPEINQNPAGYSLDWTGDYWMAYFIQWSTDLENWSYFPTIYSGDGSLISHGFNSTASEFFVRLAATDLYDFGNPYTADFDNDGLSSWVELASSNQTDPLNPDTDGDKLLDGWEVRYGYDPTNPDTDGDGIPDGEEDPDGDGVDNEDEQDNGGNPNDAIDDGQGPLVVIGDGDQDEEVVDTRTYTVPAGGANYLVASYVYSDEYLGGFTEDQSEWNDTLRWKITPSNGDEITDTISVNSLHDAWDEALIEGTSFLNYSPVVLKILGSVESDPNTDVTVEVEAGVTNIGDGDYPSVAFVSLLPVEFITPAGDPVNAPKVSGEGQNEFTFDDAIPGVLELSFKVKIPGAGDLPTEIQNEFSFDAEAIGTSQMNWSAYNMGGEATIDGDFLTATVEFTGLPTLYTDFGRKIVTLNFEGEKISEQDFEVFYPGLGRNHQDAANPDYDNWFVYYKQNEGGGLYRFREGNKISITLFAGAGDQAIRMGRHGSYVQTTTLNYSFSSGNYKVSDFTQNENFYYKGFIGVLAHERHHANIEGAGGGGSDPDGDGLTTDYENNTSKTDPFVHKSASIGAASAEVRNLGDNETYPGGFIEFQALQNVDTSQDWADPGTNHAPPQ